jgi:hypothetical protein
LNKTSLQRLLQYTHKIYRSTRVLILCGWQSIYTTHSNTKKWYILYRRKSHWSLSLIVVYKQIILYSSQHQNPCVSAIQKLSYGYNTIQYMRIPVKDIPSCIMTQNNLQAMPSCPQRLSVFLVDIPKGIYVWPSSSWHYCQQAHQTHCYIYDWYILTTANSTLNLFTHITCPI